MKERIFHSKKINGTLWISIRGSLHGIEFDGINHLVSANGETNLVSFKLDGNSVLVFRSEQLKGLKVSNFKNNHLQYDFF